MLANHAGLYRVFVAQARSEITDGWFVSGVSVWWIVGRAVVRREISCDVSNFFFAVAVTFLYGHEYNKQRA